MVDARRRSGAPREVPQAVVGERGGAVRKDEKAHDAEQPNADEDQHARFRMLRRNIGAPPR
jgi:hypothetical protein